MDPDKLQNHTNEIKGKAKKKKKKERGGIKKEKKKKEAMVALLVIATFWPKNFTLPTPTMG